MIPVAVMIAAILMDRVFGGLGMAALDDWQAATRAGLAVMFVFTGHAVRAQDLAPDPLDLAALVVHGDGAMMPDGTAADLQSEERP